MLHELQPVFPQQLLPGVVQRFNGDMESAAAFLLQAGAVDKQEAFVEGLRQRELQRLKEQGEDAKVCPPPHTHARTHAHPGACALPLTPAAVVRPPLK